MENDLEDIELRLTNLSPQQLDSLIATQIAKRCETPKDIKTTMIKLEGKVGSIVRMDKELEYKIRWDATTLYDALSYQMENECHPNEVYTYILEIYKKDNQWLSDTKYTPIPKKQRRQVVGQIIREGYPLINKTSAINLDIKNHILSADNPSKMFYNIYEYVCVVREFDKLRKELYTTSTELLLSQLETSSIEDNISNPKMLQAVNLHNQGLTQEEISKILNMSRKTVGRWLKKVNK